VTSPSTQDTSNTIEMPAATIEMPAARQRAVRDRALERRRRVRTCAELVDSKKRRKTGFRNDPEE